MRKLRPRNDLIKSSMRLVLFTFFSFIIQTSNAQKVWVKDYNPTQAQLHITTDQFTAFTIRIEKPFTNSLGVLGIQADIAWDEHVINEDYRQSILYVKEDSVLDLLNCKGIKLQVIFQNVPEMPSVKSTQALRRNTCSQPVMVHPETWRQGLDAPAPNPQSTQLRHCIVHHSAGGNGNTNYTSLVRNYYVQHTEVNGWDDIGYNFLVAFDGTVFIGRDKQTLMVPQYNVQGAHFCAKNAGTAGICMIGNYNDIKPSDTMMHSLKSVMAWIFFQEERSAMDSTQHPSPTDQYLDHIAGHRQGCATACPGDSVFMTLDSVRIQTEVMRKECIQFVGIPKIHVTAFNYIVKDGQIIVTTEQHWELYNLLGERIAFSSYPKSKDTRVNLKTGFYILKYEGGSAKLLIP